MEANRSRTRWTYAEFARLPSDDGNRYEIVDGVVVVTPAPSRGHQRISIRLASTLHAFAAGHGLGEVYAAPFDVLFGEGDYFEPDVLFVDRDRLGILSDRGCEGPPDLVVEILSASTAERDRGIKLDRYRLYGVREYWVVDPETRTIEVWDLATGAELPAVIGPDETLRWTPRPDGSTLDVSVAELFEP
jgi:Uma2 family endonuclease